DPALMQQLGVFDAADADQAEAFGECAAAVVAEGHAQFDPCQPEAGQRVMDQAAHRAGGEALAAVVAVEPAADADAAYAPVDAQQSGDADQAVVNADAALEAAQVAVA